MAPPVRLYGFMHPFCHLPATTLARLIATGQATPTEVLEAHIERVASVNPSVHAVVANRFDAARAEAAAQTEQLAAGATELPPLFGVPCTVKELIAVEGMPWTAGVVARQDVTASEDGPQVQRLREAGAIVMGVTNVSEAGLWLESVNRIYGRTRNPWDLRRSAGGSSGGEAAIIAAGGSPMGLGADIGGSIRNPCFFNGIVGHKPSGGYLPAAGHWPPVDTVRHRYCVTGPMGRTVQDLETMMQVLSVDADPHADADVPRFQPLAVNPEEVTVHWFVDNGVPLSGRCEPAVRDAVEGTVRSLARQGFRTERYEPSHLSLSAEIWGARLATTGDPTVAQLLGHEGIATLLAEWAKWPTRRSKHQLISLIMATFEPVTHVEGRMRSMNAAADEMRAEIEATLGPRGVLICPVYPRSAHRHRWPVLRPTAYSYCGVINVLELAATAVPTGFDRRKMPVGVQVVAGRHNDPLALTVARQVEALTPDWQPAPC